MHVVSFDNADVVSRYEKECQALQKDGKAYWDAMRGMIYSLAPRCLCGFTHLSWIAMTAAQSRIGDTIDLFYGAADRTSDGALAGHSYKRCVDDLDTSFTREMVCYRFYRLTPHHHRQLYI